MLDIFLENRYGFEYDVSIGLHEPVSNVKKIASKWIGVTSENVVLIYIDKEVNDETPMDLKMEKGDTIYVTQTKNSLQFEEEKTTVIL